MVMLASAILGILIGILRGGLISNLMQVNVRTPYLLLLYAVSDSLLSLASDSLSHPSLRLLVILILLIQYTSILMFVMLNRRITALLLVGVGEGMNAAVIFLNQGKMPVSTDAILNQSGSSLRLIEGKVPNYELISDHTVFPWFADIFPFHTITVEFLSIGDFIIVIGIFVFFIRVMSSRCNSDKS